MDPANLLTKRHWIVELARRKPGAVLYSLNHVIDFEWMRPALPAGRKVVAQVAGPTNAPACPILGQLQRDPRTPPAAPPPDRPSLQPSSPVKNRMREICTSGTVGGEGGNILAYPAAPTWQRHVALHPPWAQCAEFIIGARQRRTPGVVSALRP